MNRTWVSVSLILLLGAGLLGGPAPVSMAPAPSSPSRATLPAGPPPAAGAPDQARGPISAQAPPTSSLSLGLEPLSPTGDAPLQDEFYPDQQLMIYFFPRRMSDPTQDINFVITATYPAEVDYIEGSLHMGDYINECEHYESTRTFRCGGTFPPADPPVWREGEISFAVELTCQVYDDAAENEELEVPARVVYSDGEISANEVLIPIGFPFALQTSSPQLAFGLLDQSLLLYTVPKDEEIPECCTQCPLDVYLVVNGDTANKRKMENDGAGRTNRDHADFAADDCHHSLWFKPTTFGPQALQLYLVSKDQPFEQARAIDPIELELLAQPELLVLTDLRELYNEFEETQPGSCGADSNNNCIHDYYEAISQTVKYALDHKGIVMDVRQDAYQSDLDYAASFDNRRTMGLQIDNWIPNLPGSIQQTVLVGDDAVVPFYREPVRSGAGSERKYIHTEVERGGYTGQNYTLLDVGQGARGTWMCDAPYGSFSPGFSSERLSLGLGRIYRDNPIDLANLIVTFENPLPLSPRSRSFIMNSRDEAVGKEVEFHQIAIDTLVPPVKQYYGAVTRHATHPRNFAGNYPAGAHWVTGEDLLLPNGSRWNSRDVFRKVKGQTDLLIFCTHGRHWQLEDGENDWMLSAILDSRPHGASIPPTYRLLVIGACHTGLNLARFDGGEQWSTMISRQALNVNAAHFGVTSYDIGDDLWGDFDYYHDQMRRLFLERLFNPRYATLGDVIKAAHSAYDVGWRTDVQDIQVLNTVILYGLPTQKIQRKAGGQPLTVRPLAQPTTSPPATQSLDRSVVISHVQAFSDTLGRVAFALPHNGRLDGLSYGPALPTVRQAYPLPAAADEIRVTLTYSSSYAYGRPVEMIPIVPFAKGLGPLSGTITLTKPYPETILDYGVYSDAGGLMLELVLVPLQYDPDSQEVTLYDQLDYRLSYSAPTTLTVQAITINNGLPIEIDQPALPFSITVNATQPFDGQLFWEIRDAAGRMLLADYGAVSLGAGTFEIGFVTDTLGWEPGPKQVLVSLSDAPTTSETGTIWAAGQEVFTAQGNSLDVSTDKWAYGPADTAATISAEVRDQSGASVLGLAGDLTQQLDGSPLSLAWHEGAPYSATLDLSGLITGQHRLSVTLPGGRVAETRFLIDHDAPTSTLSSPALARGEAFTVSISGGDDASGVDTYFLQYRIGESGPWIDWLTRTAGYDYDRSGLDDLAPTFGPSEPISLTPEMTYCFRVRAIDYVGNWEEEHADADTCTFYTEQWDVHLPLLLRNWQAPVTLTLEALGQAGGPIYGLVVRGDYAYVAEGATLSILDISDRSDPVRVGALLLPYQTNDVAVSGNYAYVTVNSDAGLRVVDISDPTHPVEVSAYEMYGYSLGVDVVGGYAYVIKASAGWRVLNVFSLADPANPTWEGSVSVSLYAWNLHVDGAHAYLAGGPDGLQIVSVADPANPTLVGTYDAIDASDVYVAGSHAYVAAETDGLQVLLLTDPANPTPVGSYASSWAHGVHVDGDYAYLADDDGLMVLSVANPAEPTLVGSTGGNAGTVYVDGDYAYVTTDALFGLGGGNLRIISIANKANPTEVGVRWALTDLEGIYVAGDYAYVADRALGMGVISLADPTNPTLVGVFDTPSLAVDVHVAGDYAYVVDNEQVGPGDVAGRVRVVSVADPGNPTQVGVYETSGWVEDVYVAGDYAYVAHWESLRVVSVADPANPVEVGSLSEVETPQEVYVSGDYAYVADGTAGLRIISVANPASPVQVGLYATQDTAWGVHVVDDYAYVAADTFGGLEIASVADPANPAYVGAYDTPGQAQRVYAIGDYAYVADGISGLQAISVADPVSPTLVADFDVGAATDVYATGAYTYIYIADRQNGLIILQLAAERYD